MEFLKSMLKSSSSGFLPVSPVFPNVPEVPGMPCQGEDREFLMFYFQYVSRDFDTFYRLEKCILPLWPHCAKGGKGYDCFTSIEKKLDIN